MDDVISITSTSQQLLDLPPSCMQFCPFNYAYFVVGTYNLQHDEKQAAKVVDQPEEPDEDTMIKKRQSRNGSLLLFQLDGNCFGLVQTDIQPSALLDLRFHPDYTDGKGILAVVSSTGSLAIYSLEPRTSPTLAHIATSRCEDLGEEVLFLQCNWHPSIKNIIAVTTSTGLARLLHLDPNWRIKGWTDLSIKNTLEAWSINFSASDSIKGRTDQPQPTTIYCGGDDSLLRYTSCFWTENANGEEVDDTYSAVDIKGQHDAGVTAILPLSHWTPSGGRIVLTGSYDDRLRVFAIHDLHESYGAQRVQLLSDINLGGGVWRLNLIDICPEPMHEQAANIRVLASCMHAGARIVNIATRDGKLWECSVLAKFDEHQSMNYASDFKRSSHSPGLQCISTSFYDKLLCLWTYDPSNLRV